jgi:SAM-dependent methyltransferase
MMATPGRFVRVSGSAMSIDVVELRNFYGRPMGQIVRRLLLHRIRARWRRLEGETVIGVGFTSPYLGAFRGEALRVGAFSPAVQGALVWPQEGPSLTVLVDEETLPLPDNSVSRLLAIHCLEFTGRSRPLLREMWRVLAPEGRIMIVVPNRASMWARFDATPFGQGQPYSRAQLDRLLRDAMFTPVEWSNALHVPPLEWNMVMKSATAFERLGARLSLAFGGVIIVEAKKEVEALVGKPAKAPRRLPQLIPARTPTAKVGRSTPDRRRI